MKKGKDRWVTSKLMGGVCVSCGRASGSFYRVCPYCGERVWQPAWRRAACGLLLALPPLLVAALAWGARDGIADGLRALGRLPTVPALLLAVGVGLLLTPCRDEDLTVSSQRELARWQAQAVCGSTLCGVYALAGAVCVARGCAWSWLAAAALALCVGVAPVFFRIPWRAPLAAALVASAVAMG